MRKLVFSLIGCFAFSLVVNAQDEPLTNKNGQIILPQKGDYGLGFNAIPIFTFIGNAFNGNNFNNAMGSNKFVSMFGENTVFGKYFIADREAIRVDLRIGIHSFTQKSAVVDDLLNSPDSLAFDRIKYSNQNYTVGAGYEWRVGKGRLQGVYGGGLYYTYASAPKVKYEYANQFSDGNINPTSTIYDNFGNALMTNPMGERIASRTGGNTWGVGARMFVGVEYFIAPKISLGAEFGWSIGYSKTSDALQTYNSWDAPNSSVHVREVPSGGVSRFDADMDNFKGALYLMFHFK
ncbi:MAG: hypothetical protein M9916_05260 [Crocinitomicaceae bacterium]|nr:hypothetical protein [Crocinitomicaceae bacterium]